MAQGLGQVVRVGYSLKPGRIEFISGGFWVSSMTSSLNKRNNWGARD